MTMDESNAFTHIETPSSWWPHMAAPVVFARELPQAWVAGRWGPGARLRQRYRRLGMGHTHAAFILLTINRRYVGLTLQRSKRFGTCRILNDAEHRRTRVRLRGDQVALYIHLDDFGIFGASAEAVEPFRGELRKVFT